MFYQNYFGIILIIGIALYALSFLLVSKVKNVSQIRKSAYLILPNIFMMAAIIFFNTYDSTTLPPKPTQEFERIDSLEKAEDRIRALESHSREVEIYLNGSRNQMFILLGGLSLMFLIPLFVIAIGIAKPLESSEIKQENVS